MRVFAIACVLAAIFASLGFGYKAFEDTLPNPNARVTVHVLPHQNRTCTKNFPTTISSCNDIIPTYPGCEVDFFVVFYDLTEWAGCEYGVTWEGSSCSFTSCSLLTIGDIRFSGDGVSHAFGTCRTDPVCIPGFGWITTTVPTRISAVPHPAMGGLYIGDCGPNRDGSNPRVRAILCEGCDNCWADRCGYAGICGELGIDPCEVTTERTTWGQIKALFR